MSAQEKAGILNKFLSTMTFRCRLKGQEIIFDAVSECEPLTGYTPEEMTSGMFAFTQLIYPNDAERAMARLHTTLETGTPTESLFNILTKEGGQKRVLARVRVSTTDDEGYPIAIEGILTDITGALRTEASERSNRDNFDFWLKMGYEVRTPMNAILGLSEITLREDLPTPVRAYTQEIKSSARKLMYALDNIVDFKNLENNNLQIIPEVYDIASIVNDTVNMINEQKGELAFYVYMDATLPSMLIGDAIRLRRILFNLLTNAVKFTKKGFVSLSVEGRRLSDDEVELSFIIEDTGRGIKEEDKQNLFKQFTQFDEESIEGLGLGLNIANHLTALMGGSIELVSAYGVGSIFTVKVLQGISGVAMPVCPPTEGKRVALIFEPDAEAARNMKKTLINMDFDVYTALSVPEFNELVKNGGYTHIFADVSHDTFLTGVFRHTYPDLYPDTRIIFLANALGEGVHGGCATVARPFYCLSVESALNETLHATAESAALTSFTAPDARVLVVDDINANLTVAHGFLKPYGATVDYCESGAQAIEMVRRTDYDLIFMDHLMPVLSGVQATELIRDMGKTMPIVALTANTDFESRELFRQSGASDFLAKPINALRLKLVIEKWIPKEKRVMNTAPSAPVKKAEAPPFTIEGVNTVEGMEKTGGDPMVYMGVINNYYESGQSFIDNLRGCAQKNDRINYTIYVHGLAGISDNIGANHIAKTAKKLENASAKGDWAYVLANTPSLIEQFMQLLDAISTVITKMKILYIDDTATYLLLLKNILGKDYDVHTAANGEDGLKLAHETQPDLILLDLLMPGLSGTDVLKALKDDDTLSPIPVVILSAKDDEEERENLTAMGASGYIKKPFTPDSVKNGIKTYIKRRTF
jgi:PAS domain S-box-containing protein